MSVEIYIQNPNNDRWEVIDLFEEESININYKLKDLSDIAKVFSTYSQDFTVPASGHNNKVFNYFFNTTVQRIRKRGLNAKIYVNDRLFRTGQIIISEGKVENFKLSTYRVEFRTVVAQIKEKVGDDLIGDVIGEALNENYSMTWDDQSVYNKIAWSSGDEDILVPLVSNTRVWTYNDGGGTDIKVPANAIRRGELRPAIKLRVVLELLLDYYDLDVHFPLMTDNEVVERLYIWLNGKSKDEDQPPVTYNFSFTQNWNLVAGGTPTNTKQFFDVTNDNGGYKIVDTGNNYSISRFYSIVFKLINITNVSDSLPYEGRIVTTLTQRETGTVTTIDSLDVNNNALIYSRLRQGRTGEIRTFDVSFTFDNPVDISSIDSSISNLHWTTGSLYPSNRIESTGNSLPFIHNDFNIKYALGEWKVIDLFSSIFKTFNIRVVEDFNNNSMSWLTPMEYYSDNNVVDINKDTDVFAYTIMPTTNYKQIEFKHTDEEYFRNVEYSKLVNKPYGSEIYSSDDSYLTETYEVETNFSVMNWFLLQGTDLKTSYGFSVPNEPQEPSVPTIMYSQGFNIIRTDDDAMNVDFRFKTPTSGNPNATSQLARYIKFGNQSSSELDLYKNSITFDIDIEPEANTPMLKSLYNNYYKTDIERLYRPNSNYYNFEGYLSLNKVVDFDMRNQLIIEDSLYTIEEANIDITTGKFKMKLLNILNPATSLPKPPNMNTFSAEGSIYEIFGGMNIVENDVEVINYEVQYRLSNSSGSWISTLVPYQSMSSVVYNLYNVEAGNYTVRGRTVGNNFNYGNWSTINNVIVSNYPEALVFTANGDSNSIEGVVNVTDDPLNPLSATHWLFEYKLKDRTSWLSYQIDYIPFQSTIYNIPNVTPAGTYSVRVMLIGDNGKKGIWKQINNVIVT